MIMILIMFIMFIMLIIFIMLIMLIIFILIILIPKLMLIIILMILGFFMLTISAQKETQSLSRIVSIIRCTFKKLMLKMRKFF